MPGFLGSIFDYNRDGKLSALESAMEYRFLEELTSTEEKEEACEEEWNE